MQQQIGATVPLETVAAITAVLALVMDTPAERLLIRSIRPLASGGPTENSPWAMAGRLEQQLARRQAGLRV